MAGAIPGINYVVTFEIFEFLNYKIPLSSDGMLSFPIFFSGFIAVYIAGYQLEVTKSWTLVFNQTAGVCFFGWIIYLIFGTGKKLIT